MAATRWRLCERASKSVKPVIDDKHALFCHTAEDTLVSTLQFLVTSRASACVSTAPRLYAEEIVHSTPSGLRSSHRGKQCWGARCQTGVRRSDGEAFRLRVTSLTTCDLRDLRRVITWPHLSVLISSNLHTATQHHIFHVSAVTRCTTHWYGIRHILAFEAHKQPVTLTLRSSLVPSTASPTWPLPSCTSPLTSQQRSISTWRPPTSP